MALISVKRDDQTYGPYTIEELKAYVATENIELGDLARLGDSGPWRTVKEFIANENSHSAPISKTETEAQNRGSISGDWQPAFANISQYLTLTSYAIVWQFEKQEISDYLSYKKPNVIQQAGKSAEKKLAIFDLKPESFRMPATMLLAGSGIAGILAGAAAVAGTAFLAVDFGDKVKVIKQAENAQRLLALTGKPLSSISWDMVKVFMANLQEWTIPLLANRLQNLKGLLKLSPENEDAASRVRLYGNAIDELRRAQEIFVVIDTKCKEEWRQREADYQQYAGALDATLSEKKRQIELGKEALLYSQDEYERRLDEIELQRRQNRCGHRDGISFCKNLTGRNQRHCFEHTCFHPGCDDETIKEGHYCEKHLGNLADADVMLFIDEQGQAAKSKPKGKWW